MSAVTALEINMTALFACFGGFGGFGGFGKENIRTVRRFSKEISVGASLIYWL